MNKIDPKYMRKRICISLSLAALIVAGGRFLFMPYPVSLWVVDRWFGPDTVELSLSPDNMSVVMDTIKKEMEPGELVVSVRLHNCTQVVSRTISYYYHPLAASGRIITLDATGGTWVVTSSGTYNF